MSSQSPTFFCVCVYALSHSARAFQIKYGTHVHTRATPREFSFWFMSLFCAHRARHRAGAVCCLLVVCQADKRRARIHGQKCAFVRCWFAHEFFFFCVVLSCVLFYPRDFPCWLTAAAPRSTATGCVRRPPSARTKPLKRHQIKRVDAAAQNKWCCKSGAPKRKCDMNAILLSAPVRQ